MGKRPSRYGRPARQKNPMLARSAVNDAKNPMQPIIKLMEAIQSEFKSQLTDTNILSLWAIARDKELLLHYFTARNLHMQLLGNNVIYLDRVFRSALADTITRDMFASMRAQNTVLPGLWNFTNVRSLLLTMINIATISDDPGAGYFLSAHRHKAMPTAEEASEYADGTWLPYNNYTPGMLYKFCATVQQAALGIIMKEISDVIPSASFSSKETPTTIRYGMDLGYALKDRIPDEIPKMPVDEQVKDFFAKFEEPLMIYMSSLLTEAGFSVDIIKETFAASNAVVTNDTWDPKKRVDRDLYHSKSTVQYHLMSNDGTDFHFASPNFKPDDIVSLAHIVRNIHKDDPEDSEEAQKIKYDGLIPSEARVVSRVGALIKDFLEDLSWYVTNHAIVKYQMIKSGETVEPAQPESPESDNKEPESPDPEVDSTPPADVDPTEPTE